MSERPLPKDAWAKFAPDGVLFESLAFDLLKSMYPQHEFRRTQRTHDYGRDAEACIAVDNATRIRRLTVSNGSSWEKWWAEAKSVGVSTRVGGSKGLSMGDISKTLYMAYLEKVNRVIVFSYAPFNSEFWRFVNRSDDERAPVVVGYSGAQLDELVLRHIMPDARLYERYFGSAQPVMNLGTACHGVKVRLLVRTPTLGEGDGHAPPVFSVNEVIEADLFATNPTDHIKHVSIRVPTEVNPTLEFLGDLADGNEVCWEVPPHSSKSFVAHIRVVAPGKDVRVPHIHYRADGGSDEVVCPSARYDFRWLAETDLIGGSSNSAIAKFESLANCGQPSCLLVEGRSGTGKTRVLRDIEARFGHRYQRVSHFDADRANGSAAHMLRYVISRIEGMPLLKDVETKSLLDRGYVDESMSLVTDVLYEPTFDLASRREVVADFLVGRMVGRGILLVFDNVQNYDEEFVKLLQDTVSRMQLVSTGKSSMVLSFNTDELSGRDEAISLLERLKVLAASSEARYAHASIEGFSESDARDYIGQCLGLGTCEMRRGVSYDESIAFIVRTWGTVPFVLRQLLLCMQDSGVLRAGESTHFIVADPAGFHEALRKVPAGIQALMAMRAEAVDLLASSSGVASGSFRSLMAVLAFLKRMPYQLYASMFGDARLLEIVLRSGLVERATDGSIVFGHRYIHNYFKSVGTGYADLIPYDKVVSAIEVAGVMRGLFTQYFIARVMSSEQEGGRAIDDGLVRSAIRSARFGLVDPEYCMEFYVPLVSLLGEYSHLVSSSDCPRLFRSITDQVTPARGAWAQNIIAGGFVDYLLDGTWCFEGFAIREAAWIACDFVRTTISAGRASSAIGVAEFLIKHFEGYSEREHVTYACFYLNDCVVTAHYQRGDTSAALERAEFCERLVRNCGDPLLVARSQFIRGDVLYHASDAGRHRKEICESWLRAYETYAEAYGSDGRSGYREDEKLNFFLRASLADLIMQNPDAHPNVTTYVEGCINRCNSAFFEIKMRLAAAARMIVRGSTTSMSRTMRYLSEAADRSVVYDKPNSNVAAHWLRAAAELALGGSREDARRCLLDALTCMESDMERRGHRDGWDYLLASLARLEEGDTARLGFAPTLAEVRDRIETLWVAMRDDPSARFESLWHLASCGLELPKI